MRSVSSTRYQNLMATLIAALIFVLPSNLFYKLWEQTAYNQGLLIDYLIPKIYLSDILILAVFGVFCAKNCHKVKLKFSYSQIRNWLLPIALFSLLLVHQFFTPHPIIAVWTIGKLTVFLALTWVLTRVQAQFQRKHWQFLSYIVALTIVFQACLVLFQAHYQQPLFGYLFLGEPNIAQPVGIAYSIDHLGQQRALPYGTTAHPNVLAGIAVIYLWIYWRIVNKIQSYRYQRIISLITSAAVVTILGLTHSLTAWLGLGWMIAHYFVKKSQRMLMFSLLLTFIIIPLLIAIFTQLLPANDSLTRRHWLTTEAIAMFGANPLFGVGMNQFTTKLSPIGQSLNGPAFIQPAHHILWLWLAETGILGITLIIYLFQKLSSTNQQRIKYIFTMLVGFVSLDHYLLTHQAGLLLLVLVFSFAKKSNPTEKLIA